MAHVVELTCSSAIYKERGFEIPVILESDTRVPPLACFRLSRSNLAGAAVKVSVITKWSGSVQNRSQNLEIISGIATRSLQLPCKGWVRLRVILCDAQRHATSTLKKRPKPKRFTFCVPVRCLFPRRVAPTPPNPGIPRTFALAKCFNFSSTVTL